MKKEHFAFFSIHTAIVVLFALIVAYQIFVLQDRAYTTQTTVTLTASVDGKINQNASGTNYGSDQTMEIQRQSGSNTRRVLVKFDLSSIPSGATIDSATLTMYQSGSGSGLAGVQQDLHRVTRDWTESQMAWNKANSGTNWTTAGGDYDATATATLSPSSGGGNGNTRAFTVTTDVAAFVAGTQSNYGWIIKFNNESAASLTQTFHSSESASSQYWPSLSVTYTANSAPRVAILSLSQRRDGSDIVDASVEAYDPDADKLKMRIFDAGVCSGDSDQLTLGASVTAGTNDSGGAPDVNVSNYYQIGSTATTQIVTTASNTLQMTWLADSDAPDSETSICFGAGVNDSVLSATSTLSFVFDTKAPTDPGNLASPIAATSSATFGSWGSACSSADTNFKEYKLHYGTSAGITTANSSWVSSTHAGLGISNCSGVGGSTEFWGLLTGTTYYTRLFAYDLYGHYASSSSEVSFTTLVQTPGAPTVTASSTSVTSLVVVIDTAGNSDSIKYDICKTDGGISCAVGGYVQADGSLGASSVKRTYAEWGGSSGVSVTGLSVNTAYAFSVRGYRSDDTGATTDSNASNSVYTLANQVTSYNDVTNATVTSTLGVALSWVDSGQTGLKIERDSGCDGTYDATLYDNASQNETSPTTTINVAAATCYKFRYSSYNSGGVLNTTNRPETAIITTPPAQPTDLAASSADTTSITWTWTSNGGTCFDIYYSSSGALAALCASSPVTLSSLSPNTQYSVLVRARNDNGSSIASSAASTYTDANTPTSLSHTSQTISSMRWTWVSGGSQSAYYAFDNGNVSNNSGWITDTFWDQTSMSANTAYTVAVKARNDLGEETGTATITRYTSQNTPTDVSFSGITASSITATAGGSFPNIGTGSSALVFSNGAGSTQSVTSGASWTNSDLSPNTQYTYTVYATNGDGDQTSSASAATYTLAAAAGTPSAAPASATSLTLTLDRNSNPVGTNVRLYETTTGQYVDTGTRALTGTPDSFASFTSWGSPAISGLTPNTGYRFLATTQNTNSVLSASSSASSIIYTYANTPASVSASATNATQATISWGANSNPAGTQYYAENVTAGTNSGWITAQTWTSTGLTCGTTYTLRVKARNTDEAETETQSVTTTTSNCEASPGVSSAPAQPTVQNQAQEDTVAEVALSIITPKNKSSIEELPFDVTGTTTPGYVVVVSIASSTYELTASKEGSYKVTVLDQLVPGSYTITVRATDAQGVHSKKEEIVVTYITQQIAQRINEEQSEEEQSAQIQEEQASTESQSNNQTSAPSGGVPVPAAPRPSVISKPQTAPSSIVAIAPTIATVDKKVREAVIGKEAFLLVRQPSSAVFDQSQVGPLVLAGEKNIDLVVRPKVEVKSIVVRLYKKDGSVVSLPTAAQQVSFVDWINNFFAPKVNAKTVSAETPVASFVIPYDPSLNVYRSTLDFPDLPKGEYTFVMTFNVKDGTQLKFSKAVVSLGKGYVYEPNGTPAARARITLYKQSSTGEYTIWASDAFGQRNPLLADAEGGYAAYVPQGNYYFTADVPGAALYHSRIFTFKTPSVIVDDVYTQEKQQDFFSRVVAWWTHFFSVLFRAVIGPWS